MANAGQKIVDRILNDAKRSAEEIIEEASRDIQEMLKQTAAEIAAKKLRDNEVFEREATIAEERILAQAGMDCRKKLLAAKVEIMEQAYSRIEEKLLALPENEYIDLMVRMLCSQKIEEGDTIYLSKNDLPEIGRKLITAANDELERKGVTHRLKLSDQPGSIKSGYILSKGDIEYNNSFEVIIKSQKDTFDTMLVNELFG